jgi:hypothetical protein
VTLQSSMQSRNMCCFLHLATTGAVCKYVIPRIVTLWQMLSSPLIGGFRLRGANDKLPVVTCDAITAAAAATTTCRRHGF